MALCGPCQAESDRWLDYQVPVLPSITQIGSPSSATIVDVRKARAATWRRTITKQQALIADICALTHKENT